MRYDPFIHHRRSIRLKGYDYSQVGAYYVTIVAAHRECLFGEIENGEMCLNDLGNIVREEWLQTAQVRPNVELDEFVVMPNHFHGILAIAGDDRAPHPGSLGAIMSQFKSIVTKRVNEMRDTPGAPVWQRNYYEHIMRDDGDLNRIREYIINNPANWDADDENPKSARTMR